MRCSRGLLLLAAASVVAACNAVTGLDSLSIGGGGGDDIVTRDARASTPGRSTDAGATPSDDDDPGPGGEVDGGTSVGVDGGGGTTGGPQPVGDWPFDQGAGTSVTDVSGRGHHGTTVGGRWAADRNGVGGSAYTLVGGNDHVAIAAHSDFDRPAGAKLTMAAWARVDVAPSHAYIVEVGFGSEGFGIELRTSTVLTYWDGINHVAETSIPDVVGTWHHYAIVVDGPQVRIYFDGARVNQGSPDTTPRTATKLVFGLDVVEPSYLRGTIDRARYYREALTDAQILAEKNR